MDRTYSKQIATVADEFLAALPDVDSEDFSAFHPDEQDTVPDTVLTTVVLNENGYPSKIVVYAALRQFRDELTGQQYYGVVSSAGVEDRDDLCDAEWDFTSGICRSGLEQLLSCLAYDTFSRKHLLEMYGIREGRTI